MVPAVAAQAAGLYLGGPCYCHVSRSTTLTDPSVRWALRVRQSSWIVAVGDEVLSGHTLDTNSNWLAAQLRETPFPVARITVVPDDTAEISEVVLAGVAHGVARIFCCGGLGPTPDDRTVPALASGLGLGLAEHPATLERIRQRVQRMHREGRVPSPEPNAGNRKMALVPTGALVLRNPAGMAPPLAIPLSSGGEQRWLIALPGVPRELREIVEQEVIPTFCGGRRAVTYRESHFLGVPESQFYPILTSLAEEHPLVRFGSYPQAEPGNLIIRACSADPDALDRAMAQLLERSPQPAL